MLNKKRIFALLMTVAMVFALAACGDTEEKEPAKDDSKKAEVKTLRLATTTSTQDSGLLDVILPMFEKEYNYKVDVIAVGSGEALKLGEDGEADVLLVHSPAAEKEFIENGHGPARYDVMYNDFVVLGPKDDPAGINAAAANNAQAAFKKIYDEKAKFISRADESGTHKKELSIWEKLSLDPKGQDWYVESGKGMGDVITMTNEMLGYTLSDRATWLNYADKTDLKIVTENDKDLFNQYGVIVVDPAKNDKIDADGAKKFQDWILSDEMQKQISEYGVEEFGQALFTPNAQKSDDANKADDNSEEGNDNKTE